MSVSRVEIPTYTANIVHPVSSGSCRSGRRVGTPSLRLKNGP
jgi:hypothetical protein